MASGSGGGDGSRGDAAPAMASRLSNAPYGSALKSATPVQKQIRPRRLATHEA
jgi:hypothetical protein